VPIRTDRERSAGSGEWRRETAVAGPRVWWGASTEKTGRSGGELGEGRNEEMKRTGAVISALLLALALAGCGGQGIDEEGIGRDDRVGERAAGDEEEVVVGGFTVEGPDGREISIPETTVNREMVEQYVEQVRPIIEDTARDVSTVIQPEAELEDQTLTLSIEVESIEEAQEAAREGLEELRQIQPPDDLENVHEQLVAAYETALPAYEDIIEAFDSNDIGVLTNAVQENLPQIEQLVAEARSILQELERAESQDVVVESQN
jgi:predicted small secreted protein